MTDVIIVSLTLKQAGPFLVQPSLEALVLVVEDEADGDQDHDHDDDGEDQHHGSARAAGGARVVGAWLRLAEALVRAGHVQVAGRALHQAPAAEDAQIR